MKFLSKESLIINSVRLVTYFIVVVVGYLLFDIIVKGAPTISWSFLTDLPRKSGAEGGIYPAIIGTIYLVFGAIVVALPLGMASAIYLSEYAMRGKLNQGIRLAIITLAGVPSIVFGLFGLGLFVLFFGFGASILAGSLTLSFMILPTIIVSSEEALQAVPMGLREASLALGATQWQTVYKSVLPFALPGMFTGSILGIGRAAGETAPILLTVAAFFLPRLPSSIFDQVMALPYHLYVLATQHPDTEKVLPMQYGTALVLIIIVVFFNLTAIVLRNHFRKKIQW
ncbi:MAG: phosphate ABC transporter permease PstA [Candidatus Marinimicrobia bacterium]|nr:phosphate ABC transporter permease PstA [Candidatus Neomarinimicrobiota bacterium]